jgi:hypothetical protein
MPLMEKAWDNIKDFFKDFEMPDIGGIDGGTLQLILICIVGLWLLMKLKKLFFIFLFIVGVYYFMQGGSGV